MSAPVRTPLVASIILIALAASASAAVAVPSWQRFPLPPPPGGAFETPVGFPGDLQFWDENTGLMSVGGNQSVPEGIYHWDGVTWRQLSTVCGGGERARIAFATETEFWVIARPSPPRPQNAGFALCHFKGGAVVDSFSTASRAVDPYAGMLSAACDGPGNCWFGGVGAQDGLAQRVGAFHLHWDGTSLRTVYGPQGRAVSDMMFAGGQLYESTLLGRAPQDQTGVVDLAEPESPPRLLHRIADESFVNDPFVPAAQPANAELRALDADRATGWAVGGTPNSGAVPPGRPVRPPIASRLRDGTWTERPLTMPATLPLQLEGKPVFLDVAAVPGRDEARVVVGQPSGPFDTGQPLVGHIPAGGTVEIQQLEPTSVATRGDAVRIACPAADDCWMVTARGYVYRHSEPGRTYAQDLPPAYQGLITIRPNEAAEQGIPDTPPEDDSRLLAPPVQSAAQTPPVAERSCRRPRALISGVRVKARGRTRLVLRFRVARRARIGVVGRRGQRVVARAKLRTLKPGRRAITLRVSSRRRPTRLGFTIRGDGAAQRCIPVDGNGGSDDSVSTSPGVAPDAGGGAGEGGAPAPNPNLDDTVTTGGRPRTR